MQATRSRETEQETARRKDRDMEEARAKLEDKLARERERVSCRCLGRKTNNNNRAGG